jgi:hypothetical protein
MLSFTCSFPNTYTVYIYNIPFPHSRSDSKFIRFYIFFIRVVSLTTDNLVLCPARIMEITTHLSIFSHNLWIFEQCKISEDNCIASKSFTSCYNINSLKQIIGQICFAWKGTILPHRKVNPVKRIVLESKPEMCKWIIFKRFFPTHFCSLRFQYGEHMCSIIQIICNFIFSEIWNSIKSSNLL